MNALAFPFSLFCVDLFYSFQFTLRAQPSQTVFKAALRDLNEGQTSGVNPITTSNFAVSSPMREPGIGANGTMTEFFALGS